MCIGRWEEGVFVVVFLLLFSGFFGGRGRFRLTFRLFFLAGRWAKGRRWMVNCVESVDVLVLFSFQIRGLHVI